MWIPGSYDPETKLYIVGTGNPTPAYTSQTRGEGDNLYTCSLVAINVDTGKLAWHYSTSPHDTHDWDSAQTPVLFDGEFNGRPRKLVMQATRNGYFFVRRSGHRRAPRHRQVLGRGELGQGPRRAGQPGARAGEGLPYRRRPRVPAERWRDQLGATGLQPGYRPVLRVQNDSYSMYYLTETGPLGAMGLGGKEEPNVTSIGTFLNAIDYKTGKIAWRHRYAGSGSWGGTYIGHAYLTTAGAAVRWRSGRQHRGLRRRERLPSGTRGSGKCPTGHRPTCSTGASTCWRRRRHAIRVHARRSSAWPREPLSAANAAHRLPAIARSSSAVHGRRRSAVRPLTFLTVDASTGHPSVPSHA